MIINTAVGVQRVPQDYMNVARVLNLSEWKIVSKILFPSVLPYMLTGVRLAVGTAWLVIVPCWTPQVKTSSQEAQSVRTWSDAFLTDTRTCLKAGLLKDAWKDERTDIFAFTALVLEEPAARKPATSRP